MLIVRRIPGERLKLDLTTDIGSPLSAPETATHTVEIVVLTISEQHVALGIRTTARVLIDQKAPSNRP